MIGETASERGLLMRTAAEKTRRNELQRARYAAGAPAYPPDPEFRVRESERGRRVPLTMDQRKRKNEKRNARYANDSEYRSQRLSRQKELRNARYRADPQYRAAALAKGAAQYQRDKASGVWRANQLKTRYGLTVEAHDVMLAKQGGVCAICGGPPTRRDFDVDHDHATGLVRGLLCSPCNTALGLLGDDPARARRLAEYVEDG